MAEIKEGMTVLGLLERGKVVADLTTELEGLLETLQEVAGDHSKAKGSISLKLNLEVKDGTVLVSSEFATKAPKMPRPHTAFFLTADGKLSTDHPNQVSMFPREVPPMSGDKAAPGMEAAPGQRAEG